MEEKPTQGIWGVRAGAFARAVLYLALALAAAVVPVILWYGDLPFISSTYGERNEPFELFGFTTSLVLIAGGSIELWRRRLGGNERQIPVVVMGLVGFSFLYWITESSVKTWDYCSFESAARAVVEGRNPYGASAAEGYFYNIPPLVAQILAFGYRVTSWGAGALRVGLRNEEDIWSVVFYFYRCCQFGLVLGVFYLCYRFARRVGMKAPVASVVVAALFLFDNPLVRTVRHDQTSLLILGFIVLAALLYRSYPLLSGLAVGVGAFIKPYPLFLLLPWVVMRRRLAVLVGWVIGALAVVVISSDFGRNWQVWQEFVAFAMRSKISTSCFRANCIYGIVTNVFRSGAFLTGADVTGDVSAWQEAINGVVVLFTLVIVVWFVVRFVRRERAFADFQRVAGCSPSLTREEVFRIFGHVVDAVALALLVSTHVWEHHYVLTIPIVIWALATRGRDKPWLVGVSALLMLTIPTFDVFPFSYHRIVGLLMLVYLTSPEKVRKVWVDPKLKPTIGGLV